MTKYTRTKYVKNVLDNLEATELYNDLLNTIEWRDGVKSKKEGFTRLAYTISIEELVEKRKHVLEVIYRSIAALNLDGAKIYNIYLNYYRNGNDFTPNHSHKNSKQIIISLGATRTLKVGSKDYKMNNGDVIIFGSSIHGVPKEPEITEGRISIAVFCCI